MSYQQATRLCIIVLAHNEERRIGTCLASLPPPVAPGLAVHVVVNGSVDATAPIARGFSGVVVHEWEQGGKSRSWNRIMFDTPGVEGDVFVFVDGDAEVLPGSVDALVQELARTGANAAAGMPANGRRATDYRARMMREHGLFGDLYALSGDFVARMRAADLRLPGDLIGDDGLIGAWAKTDLGDESHWLDRRVAPCPEAGFLCEPTRLSRRSLTIQYRRMVNYAMRHFQNRIVSEIMREHGPTGLPRLLASLYPAYLGRFRPRRHPLWWWFDRQALQRMARAATA